MRARTACITSSGEDLRDRKSRSSSVAGVKQRSRLGTCSLLESPSPHCFHERITSETGGSCRRGLLHTAGFVTHSPERSSLSRGRDSGGPLRSATRDRRRRHPPVSTSSS